MEKGREKSPSCKSRLSGAPKKIPYKKLLNHSAAGAAGVPSGVFVVGKMVIRYPLTAYRCPLTGVGCRLPAVGCRLSTVGYPLTAVGYPLPTFPPPTVILSEAKDLGKNRI